MIDCKISDYNNRFKISSGFPLKDLTVELTRLCNFYCKHCYCSNPLFEDVANAFEPELSYEEWIHIFEQYEEEDGLFITLTGGEALLRKDFKKLWVYLKKKGFLITLFTNGSLIDEEMADFFSLWTPLQISVSLYGVSDKTYELVTGRRKMFGKVKTALDFLKKKKVPLEVKGVFSRLNVGDFDGVRKMALEYCDLFRWDMALMGSFSSKENQPKKIRLSPEEYVEYEEADPIRKSGMESLFKRWKTPSTIEEREGAFGCNIKSGSGIFINSQGIMHPCLLLESGGYNLKKGNLHEGLYEAIPNLIDTFPCKPGICQKCAVFELCGPCAAFAILEGCPVNGPVPYKCNLVKARAEKYGLTEVVDYITKKIIKNGGTHDF